MRRAAVAVLLLVLLTACGREDGAREKGGPGEAGTTATAETWPDLEPFLKAPFRQALEERLPESSWEIGAKEIRALLAQLDAQRGELQIHEAARALRGEGTERPSAELSPSLPQAQRMLWMAYPDVLESLHPCWEKTTWTAADVDLAQAVAAYASRFDPAPDPAPAFAEGDDEGNRRSLETLVRFWHEQVKRPEVLAGLIFTLDDGPFAGLEVDLPDDLAPTSSLALDDHLEVRLYVLAGPPATEEDVTERHVLAGYRDGERIWARLVSSEPSPSVREVQLGATSAKLGSYGWRFPIVADWSGGYESGDVYLAPDGAFLFYFLSW